MNSTLDVVQQILSNQMNIPASRIFAYNSNVDLPTDSALFIPLFYTERKPYANNSKMISTPAGVNEHQTVNMVEDVIIALMSKDTSARDRVQDVFFALKSNYSQDIQTQNNIRISTIGEAYDKSFLEATSMLNRFDIKIRIFRGYEKINTVDYYDKFSFETWLETQGGIIEKNNFNIGD